MNPTGQSVGPMHPFLRTGTLLDVHLFLRCVLNFSGHTRKQTL